MKTRAAGMLDEAAAQGTSGAKQLPSSPVRAHAGAHGGSKSVALAAASADEAGGMVIIKQAACFRMKYFVRRVRLPPGLVGVHYLNRDGIGVNATRCDELLGDFGRIGFDAQEADHDSICIEEEVGKDLILRFNMMLAALTPFIAKVDGDSLPYGSVAHTHVNQVCRNILLAARSERSGLVDGEGRLCLELVEKISPALANAVRSGLLWEVLSGRMVTEEKDAVFTIQAAINVKGGVQLQEHEMQAIARISRYCQSEQDVRGQVVVATVQSKISATMPEFAHCSDFQGLVAFVIDLGAEASCFISDLREFHSRFVNAKKRRLRASTFAAVSELSGDLPHCKVALIKYAYSVSKSERTDPSDPFIDVLRLAEVRKLQKAEQKADPPACGTLQDAEAYLKFIEGAVRAAGVISPAIVDLRAAMAIGTCRVLLNKRAAMPEGLESCGTACRVAELCFKKLLKLAPRLADTHAHKAPWSQDPRLDDAPAAVSKSTSAKINPIVLTFKDGQATTSQISIAEEVTTWQSLDWAHTLEPSESSVLEHKRLLIYNAVHVLWSGLEHLCTQGAFDIVKNEKKTMVKARRRFSEHELVLPPLVQSLLGVVEKSQHPHAVPVALAPADSSHAVPDALAPGCSTQFSIVPQVKYPGAGSRGAGTQQVFLPPFWLVRRVAPSSTPAPSCKLVNVQVDIIATTMLPAETAVDCKTVQKHKSVILPLMTNTRLIEAGEELTLEWAPRENPTPKSKAAPRTWRSSAAHGRVTRPAKT